MMKHLIAIVFPLTILIGCSATYEQTKGGGEISRASIPAASSVLIGTPENGRYGNTIYEGSGAMTAQALLTAFVTNVKRTEILNSVLKRETGLSKAKEMGFAYYAEPEILHWEDRATEWSGKSDKITILINILDVSSGMQIDRTIIKGTSKWATFGGDHPQDLLTEPINKYVGELVR
jgi:Domain of unknown function (DUF4823)